ncbi:DUF6264 family protein [Microbacterium sp. XT11]|uniref:DUF6264 family protein n=1 Tax=Microbacterium sp. XT11 TaxID=367477 RepID=UPI00082A4715|nr:DUF6264 family protein [Microbacterium sp. XT11]
MTDQRPQYGELATPEEQRLAAGLPPLPDPAAAAAPPAPAAAAGVPHAPGGKAGPNRADRLVTIGLLAYGLVSVVLTGIAYLDLPSVMDQNMKLLGIEGEFTNYTQGRIWGTVAAIVLALGWCVTAAVSVRRLRRRRIAWWVPLVGAAVTMLLVSFCVAVPMMGDPAFVAFVDRMATG